MGRALTTITFLLVAFYGAFFMDIYYKTNCYMGKCPWSPDTAPKARPWADVQKA